MTTTRHTGRHGRRTAPPHAGKPAALMRAAAVIVPVLMLLLNAASCSRQAPPRDEASRQRLEATDDSVAKMSPSAKSMIAEGMRTAGDSTTYYEYCLRMGRWFMLSATPDSMAPYVKATVAWASRQQPSPRRNSLLANAYATQAANMHNFHKQPDEVVRLYTKAYRLLLDSDNKQMLPRLCGNMADAYFFKDDMPGAAAWYRRALYLVDSLALPKDEDITLYLGLARIYMNLGDLATSHKYYEQTQRHYAKMQPNMQAYFLNDYGSFYYYSKDYKKSLEKFRQLERMLQRNGMEGNFDFYLCRLNLADVYLNLGDYKASRQCLDFVEPYILRMGDPAATYYVNTIKAGLALRHGDIPQVRKILDSERPGTDPGYNLRHIRNQYLREFYASTGDYRKAYALMLADQRQTDSLNHNRSNMRAAEIMDRLREDTLRLHHTLAIEQKNADIYRSNSVATALTAAVLVLGLALLAWISYSRRQNLKSRLSIMQLKLNSARNRINPHFVFNVLNNKILSTGTEEADELRDLARLIRANLDMSCHMTVTLADELAFVSRYVEVERYMLGDGFAFSVELPPDVDAGKVRVPSMFLQILAENAIVHGLKGREGSKRLTIAAARTATATVISITDNGRGFDACSTAPARRTGLTIITQTVAVINESNKHKMRFAIHNTKDSGGNITGCESTLVIPDGIKFNEPG